MLPSNTSWSLCYLVALFFFLSLSTFPYFIFFFLLQSGHKDVFWYYEVTRSRWEVTRSWFQNQGSSPSQKNWKVEGTTPKEGNTADRRGKWWMEQGQLIRSFHRRNQQRTWNWDKLWTVCFSLLLTSLSFLFLRSSVRSLPRWSSLLPSPPLFSFFLILSLSITLLSFVLG